MAVLILLFSITLYKYFSYIIDRELKASLFKEAGYIVSNYPDVEKAINEKSQILKSTLKIDARVACIPSKPYIPAYTKIVKRDDKIYLEGYFPYDHIRQRYLILSKDITHQKYMQQRMVHAIVILNSLSLIFILIYAYFLSGTLIKPIEYFSNRLAKMNANLLEPIDLATIPKEFYLLGESINSLIQKIRSFLLYKKELFVGAAHELKTPLAVMKIKCQVALMKKNPSIEQMKEALSATVSSIDDMNKMISGILEFGRAEGAQFESPMNIDMVDFIRKRVEEFELLAKEKSITIKSRLNPVYCKKSIQPLILTQILQNILQNAVRFTPEGKSIEVSSHIDGNNFVITVKDEGCGIDESIDLFAPFNRSKDSEGTGLGLFLVKSACDALGGSVSIRNRDDKKGTIATIYIPLQ